LIRACGSRINGTVSPNSYSASVPANSLPTSPSSSLKA
jgi:hypothetical protein